MSTTNPESMNPEIQKSKNPKIQNPKMSIFLRGCKLFESKINSQFYRHFFLSILILIKNFNLLEKINKKEIVKKIGRFRIQD